MDQRIFLFFNTENHVGFRRDMTFLFSFTSEYGANDKGPIQGLLLTLDDRVPDCRIGKVKGTHVSLNVAETVDGFD